MEVPNPLLNYGAINFLIKDEYRSAKEERSSEFCNTSIIISLHIGVIVAVLLKLDAV